MGKVLGRSLKAEEFEWAIEILQNGSELEKALGAFIFALMVVDGDCVFMPEYCAKTINKLSLQYCSISGFLQLPTQRLQNVFQRVISMEDVPQNNVVTIPNNKKDALVKVKFDILPVVENKK